MGTKPRTDNDYDTSRNLWMIRAYNGKVHQLGTTNSPARTIEKIHQGDTVRFEADLEECTVRCSINGVDQGVVFDQGIAGKEIFPAVCSYSSGKVAAFTKLEVLGFPASSGNSAVVGTLSTPSGTVAALSTLPYLATGSEDSKPTVSSGSHFYDKGQLDAGESAATSPIVVAGSPRANGLSLRPSSVSGESNNNNSEASVTFPLQVLRTLPDEKDKEKEKEKDSKKDDKKDDNKDKKATHRPFEFFVAKLAVDDTSPIAGATPVVITVSLDDRAIYQSPPLSVPGETHFIRLPIKGAEKLKLSAKPASSSATPPATTGTTSPVPTVAKTVILDAVVIESRDWSWSSRRTGILPGFRDNVEASSETTSEGEVAKPTTPLSLARFVASRLAFLSEAQNEVTRRGLVAITKIARITGLTPATGAAGSAGIDGASADGSSQGGNAGQGTAGGQSGSTSSGQSGSSIDVLISAARAWIAQQEKEKEKSKPSSSSSSSDKKDEKPEESSSAQSNNVISQADVFAAEGLRKLQSPYCLDVCAATFNLLRSLLAVALPYCYSENSDLFGAAPASATGVTSQKSSDNKSATNAEIDAKAALETATAAAGPNAAAPSHYAIDSQAASASAAKPWSTLTKDLLALVKAHLKRLVGSQVDPATVGIRLLAGPVGASGSGATSGGAGLLASLAQGCASRGDVTTTATRTKSGPAGISSFPSSSSSLVNPITQALAQAFGTEGNGAAATAAITTARREGAAALHQQFAPGSTLASLHAVSNEATLAPLHRLLQMVVEDQDPSLQGAAGVEEEEDEEEEEAQKEQGDKAKAAAVAAAPAALAHRSRLTSGVQSASADCIDAALSVLYPSQAERRRLLAGLIAKGGVVEIQFRFPAIRTDGIAELSAQSIVAAEKQAREEQEAASSANAADKDKDKKDKDKNKDKSKDKDSKKEKEKEAMWEKKDKEREEMLKRKFSRDPRPDRALLLLQLECQKRGLPFEMHGSWGSYAHLLIRLAPAAAASTSGEGGDAAAAAAKSASSAKAVEFLDSGFSRVFERAGLGRWTIPTGCADPFVPLKIERVLDFTSPDRTFSEGVGLVRIFPRSAGTFKAIDAGVRAAVEGYKQQAALSAAASSATTTAPKAASSSGAGAGAGKKK
jgi:hypothetical protein